MRQIGLRTWPPVAMPSRKLKAPIAPTIGSSSRCPNFSPHWSMPRKTVSGNWLVPPIVITSRLSSGSQDSILLIVL